MSFLSVLSKIARVATGVSKVAVPVVTVINPAIGGILGAVVRMIISVEAQMPEEGMGAAKKDIVIKLANAKAQAAGVALDQDRLSDMVNALVDVFNKFGYPATTISLAEALKGANLGQMGSK